MVDQLTLLTSSTSDDLFDCHKQVVLDPKNRLTLPADVRAKLAGRGIDEVVITSKFYARLEIWPSWEAWVRERDWWIANRTTEPTLVEFGCSESELYQGYLQTARRVRIDGQGRILIPSASLAEVPLTPGRVWLLSVNGRYQIVSEAEFEEDRNRLRALRRVR